MAILLAGAIAGITVALMADTIVVWANVAAWTALSVAFALLDMNPFVLAIAAIGIAVVLVVTHFKQVKKVVVDVFDWIVAHWKLLAAIILGPFGLAIDFVATHFGTIRKIAESVFHAVVGRPNGCGTPSTASLKRCSR